MSRTTCLTTRAAARPLQRLIVGAVAAAASLLGTAAQAWEPSKPVEFIVPAGVCIQEFRARIQKADMVVPKATRTVAPV